VGDAADAAAMAKGLAGARFAYHLAGSYDLGVIDADAMRNVNVEGTRAFLDALRRSEVERALLHVEHRCPRAGRRRGEGDESARVPRPIPVRLPSHEDGGAPHGRGRAARAGAPLVIVCPALVYGPGDQGPQRTVRRGRAPAPGAGAVALRPTHFSYAHVDDVVDGHDRCACERGRPGATYILSGRARDRERVHGVRSRDSSAETWATAAALPRVRDPPDGRA
jgi:dihydroflavonol-4-reductase